MKEDLTKRGVRECEFNWLSQLLQIHFKQYPAIRFYTKDYNSIIENAMLK